MIGDSIPEADCTRGAVYKGALGFDMVAHYRMASREPGYLQSSDIVAWLPDIGNLRAVMGFDRTKGKELDM